MRAQRLYITNVNFDRTRRVVALDGEVSAEPGDGGVPVHATRMAPRRRGSEFSRASLPTSQRGAFMKKIGIAISSLCLVLALGAGCKKKEGAAGGGAVPANMTTDQACDKVVAMMGDMSKAIEGAGEDCDKMGGALQKWADDNKTFMEWAKTQDKDPAKKK